MTNSNRFWRLQKRPPCNRKIVLESQEKRTYIHIDVPDIDEYPKGFPQYWVKRAFINSISTNYQINALATTYVRLVEAALTAYRLGQAMLEEFWNTHTSLNLSAMHRFEPPFR
ncbi:MAG TPA: hypothetical protein VIM34_04460 [Burkholderiaceae bacterium]